MQIILTARGDSDEAAWRTFCGDLPFVSIHRGSILDLSCDAVVSPANSFGFMDGGIDALYTERFGAKTQQRLQQLIQEKHHGELLVGNSEIVETDDASIRFVIAAPTMRVPMILKDTVNPYLAARAVFILIQTRTFSSGMFQGERISKVVESVAFPGLGTGIGQVGFNTCAHQMRAAIDDVILRKTDYPKTWADAQARHQRLYTDRIRDLQKEP
jgi:O-acetyl-ADP-ribose deacetylase (regulator of RNase III)